MAKAHFIYFDLNTGYYPNFHHGIASIVGTLRRDKHRISLSHIIHENDFDVTINYLKNESPDLIGLSFTTNQKKYVRDFLDIANLEEKLIVAGGVHTTLEKENIFQEFPEIDGICIGEGELPLLEICRRLDKNEDYYSVPSFYFQTNKGIIKNSISPLQYLDTLAMADYSIFKYEQIIKDGGNCFQGAVGEDPLVIGVVLVLGFLLLLLALQAPVIAAVGVVTNLLAVGAAFGVARLIFQDGHGAGLLGFESQGFIDAWGPVFFFAMIFAISMDYTVFLLSSAKEHYDRSQDPRDAMVGGLAHSGRVIFAAAGVMVAVFLTFALSGPLPPRRWASSSASPWRSTRS